MSDAALYAVQQENKRLRDALREIATRCPTRGKKASMRGLVVQLQSLAVSGLGEQITLGIDAYDRADNQL